MATSRGERNRMQPGRLYLFNWTDPKATVRRVTIAVAAVFVPPTGKATVVASANKAGRMVEATFHSQDAYHDYIGKPHTVGRYWTGNITAQCGDEFDVDGPYRVQDLQHFNAVADAVVGKPANAATLVERYGLGR